MGDMGKEAGGGWKELENALEFDVKLNSPNKR